MKTDKKEPLINKSHGAIFIAVILDDRRAKNNLKYPIVIRVTNQQERAYYATGYDATKDEYFNLIGVPNYSGKLTGEQKTLKEKYNNIIDGFSYVEEKIKSIKNDFSFDRLKVLLGKSDVNSVFKAFEAQIQNFEDDNKYNTADWYRCTLKSIKKHYSNDFKLKDIDVNWLKRYEKLLLTEEKTYTTISMYMRALRAILNKTGTISESNYPFGKGKYEIPSAQSRKLALTLNDVGKIVFFECRTESERRCRDYWMFSYLCNGINFVDMLQLKWSDIQQGEISFYRQKTFAKLKEKKKIAAPMLPEMKEIINTWANKDKNPKNFIFPVLNSEMNAKDIIKHVKLFTHMVNDNMRNIASELELPRISTYTARHTFSTVLKRSGANISYIAESLGHADIRTTENYLKSFEKEERAKTNTNLTGYKNEPQL
jgi:integrase/recombinase XerD